MFNQQIIDAIHAAPATQQICIIIEWEIGAFSPPDPAPDITKISREQARLQAELAAWLETQPEIGWHKIHGSFSHVLCAKKAVWEMILKTRDTPLHGKRALLHLNKEIATAPPQSS